MAIDVKNIIAQALLELCEEKQLEKITIRDILNQCGVSRQTFYNHFIDKDDLIHYIYDSRIVPDFHDQNMNISFYDSLIETFENIKKYKIFMKQACMMGGLNCLKDYIFSHCKDFDMKWHQSLYGSSPMPDALRFATEYHANASSSMTLSWILSDMPVSSSQIAKMIVDMRSLGMDVLFKDGEIKENPYLK